MTFSFIFIIKFFFKFDSFSKKIKITFLEINFQVKFNEENK